MRNNNSNLAFDQRRSRWPALGAAKANTTPVSHNSPGLSGDGDLILIRVHEGPPLAQLIVPQDRAALRPPVASGAHPSFSFLS